MDLSYATIPIFGSEQRRLYREVQLDYLVSDINNPANHSIYVVEEELGSRMLHLNNEEAFCVSQVETKEPIYHNIEKRNEL